MEPSYETAHARIRTIGGTSAERLGSFVTWLGSLEACCRSQIVSRGVV